MDNANNPTAARMAERFRGFLPRMYRLFLDGDLIPRSVTEAERQRAAQDLTQRAVKGVPATTFIAGR